MSKKFKSQASSARAASSSLGGFSLGAGTQLSSFQTLSSPLSYVTELPDFTAISDPSVVVAFKNLTKKDAVTKTKALEDLHEILGADTEMSLEPALLDAWINIYPRTSIDNSRRVRQLAHSLQGSLTVRSGKRIASQLPEVIGAWLAGTFDNDKSVSRVARESFETAFPLESKRKAVWEIYQRSLLTYAEHALLRHTSQTLSDERVTSPDDAEAKYVRVVSTAVLLLDELLQINQERPVTAHGTFRAIISAERICELTWHKDSSLRRAIYRLIQHAVEREVQFDWRLLSANLLAKALHISQTSSSGQYVDVLLAVTKAEPEIWTSRYTSKAPASRRLYQYLKQGSQRGPESWWPRIKSLIESLPRQIWCTDTTTSNGQLSLEAASHLLSSLHEGVINNDESRQNHSISWPIYVDLFFWTVGTLDCVDSKKQLLHSFLYPLVERYLFASPDLSQWLTPASISLHLCSASILKLEPLYSFAEFDEFYKDQGLTLMETMKKSQPESSKSFKQSQEDIVQISSRFFDLQGNIEKRERINDERSRHGLSGLQSSSLSSSFAAINILLLSEAVKLLRDRVGKPYGAAGLILMALEKSPSILDDLSKSPTPHLLPELMEQDAPSLLESPSANVMISILLKGRARPGFEKAFEAILGRFQRDEELRKSHAYSVLLHGITPDDLVRYPVLEQQILQDMETALKGNDSRWPTILDVLSNQNLSVTTLSTTDPSSNKPIHGRLLEGMVEGLSLDEREDNAVKGLSLLSRQKSFKYILAAHISLPSLLTRLMLLSDSSKEYTAETAAKLVSVVKNAFAQQDGNDISLSPTSIVRRQLHGEDEPLPILYVVELAQEAVDLARKMKYTLEHHTVLPTADQWRKALTPFLQLQPPPSIALISPFQGFAFLLDHERRRSSGGLPRDPEGFSMALRLAIFVTRFLGNLSLERLSKVERETLYLYYPQALQLAEDKLSIESANALWIDSTSEVVQEVATTVAEGQKHIHAWFVNEKNQNGPDQSPTLTSFWLTQLDRLDGTSAETFNFGRTFVAIVAEGIDLMGPSKFVNELDLSPTMLKSISVKSAALLILCRDVISNSPMGKRLCNELTADATGMDFEDTADALRRLAFFNLLNKGEDELISNIPSQRLIFLAKKLLSPSSFLELPAGLQCELLIALGVILPHIKELYGEFWQLTVELLNEYLSHIKDISQIIPLNSALRLYACLSTLLEGDCNEDLQEEFSKVKPTLEASMVEILTLFDDTPSRADQPLEITAALLARQVQNLKFDKMDDITELYGLLSSENRDIQGAAYGILHRSLPSIEQKQSIETVLSKTVAHIPEELLSLLLDPPSTELLKDTIQSTELIWVNIRRYLLSWKVVFDHFSNASHAVRATYVVDIKDHGHLEHLLGFACDLLRITSGRSIDASKFGIVDFKLDEPISLEKEAQWLTIHLYYLCLLHLPGLSKTWWIEQKNRIKQPLETWSQKHICPLIISACLTTVSDWHADNQETTSEGDHALDVKVNIRAAELTASIPIDPESPPIALCINLPPTYPLTPALVTSRTRVGISETKWQAWLRTIQGVIMFNNSNSGSSGGGGGSSAGSGSGSSLIDGLTAFRHNVSAALIKGQSECAICYSVIGTDMKTPEKKCATCKNMFHSACLYRWFRSSSSSSCPLCRNGFNYG